MQTHYPTWIFLERKRLQNLGLSLERMPSNLKLTQIDGCPPTKPKIDSTWRCKSQNRLSPFTTDGKITCGKLFSEYVNHHKVKLDVPSADVCSWQIINKRPKTVR